MRTAIHWLYEIGHSIRASLPRRHVLRSTGVVIELLAIESQGDVHRALVELPDGRRWLAKLEDVQSRPFVPIFFIGTCLALALGGVLIGVGLQPPATPTVVTESWGPRG